jgi:hypothetical protein
VLGITLGASLRSSEIMLVAMEEQELRTTIAHSDFGRPDCCGCLCAIVRGDQADVVCNECNTVVRTVPAVKLRQTLDEMELTLELSSAVCPYCGSVNVFPGFSQIVAFVCRECGASVNLCQGSSSAV